MVSVLDTLPDIFVVIKGTSHASSSLFVDDPKHGAREGIRLDSLGKNRFCYDVSNARSCLYRGNSWVEGRVLRGSCMGGVRDVSHHSRVLTSFIH